MSYYRKDNPGLLYLKEKIIAEMKCDKKRAKQVHQISSMDDMEPFVGKIICFRTDKLEHKPAIHFVTKGRRYAYIEKNNIGGNIIFSLLLNNSPRSEFLKKYNYDIRSDNVTKWDLSVRSVELCEANKIKNLIIENKVFFLNNTDAEKKWCDYFDDLKKNYVDYLEQRCYKCNNLLE